MTDALVAALRLGYRARVLGTIRLASVLPTVRASFAAVPALKAEAEAELQRLSSIRDLDKRDFAGTQARDFLKMVLNP